jgi:hypothetical protein
VEPRAATRAWDLMPRQYSKFPSFNNDLLPLPTYSIHFTMARKSTRILDAATHSLANVNVQPREQKTMIQSPPNMTSTSQPPSRSKSTFYTT